MRNSRCRIVRIEFQTNTSGKQLVIFFALADFR